MLEYDLVCNRIRGAKGERAFIKTSVSYLNIVLGWICTDPIGGTTSAKVRGMLFAMLEGAVRYAILNSQSS